MKTLTYSITINQPRDIVFSTITDPSVYPDWAKAWGEGMVYQGDWKEGEHISFIDESQGGTKVIIDELIPNESIRMTHVAMVNPDNVECDVPDEMMEKWIGSKEDYFFMPKGDAQTELDVVVVTDEAFEEMMNAWPKALQYLKEICES